MQCNTNYTGKIENLKFINLNVLKQFKKIFPKAILGLSDHTPGHSTVLGAITLGARVIEKHFTYSNKVDGPDHFFSMNPKSWKEMIERSKELEFALGSNNKKVENNEKETVVVQRRSAHLLIDLKKNEKIKKKYLSFLRPALNGSVKPYELNKVIKYKVKKINQLEIFYFERSEIAIIIPVYNEASTIDIILKSNQIWNYYFDK